MRKNNFDIEKTLAALQLNSKSLTEIALSAKESKDDILGGIYRVIKEASNNTDVYKISLENLRRLPEEQ